MSRYNLRNIHWLEFEELCCDIAHEILGRDVKRGKTGADGGTDGIIVFGEERAIVQAKHYIGSGCKALIKHLKSTEVAKAERLAAKRYILMTSCDLSPQNRKEILDLYHGLIKSDADIFSGTDICALLAEDKYQWITRMHYNLWLSGIEQLDRFCGDGIKSKSAAVLDGIKDDLRIAVKTEDYARALARLVNDKVIIITGQAGTGKTILAEQLIADFVFGWNYRFLCSEYDLKGFETQIERHPNDRFLFYIDDFLGANVMDALRDNRDSQIVNFIRMVRRSERLKLVLTSRSYIINEAVERTGKFTDARIASFEFRLDEKQLGRIDRAKIVLSHFHNGDVGTGYKLDIVGHENYFKIIDHPNFNPRMIAYAFRVDITNQVPIDVPDGIAKALWILDHPRQIWKDFFNSLDDLRKYIVIMVHLACSARASPSETCIREAVKRMVESDRFKDARTGVFTEILRGLCDSVLSRTVLADSSGVHASYSLSSPSVGDYIIDAYNDNETMFIEAALFLERADVVIQIARNSSWLEKTRPLYATLCKRVVQGVLDAVVANPSTFTPDYSLRIYNEVFDYDSENKNIRKLLANKIVTSGIVRMSGASGSEVIKFLYDIQIKDRELYDSVGINKDFLDKTIEPADDCETLLLLGDLYYSLDDELPDTFYLAFKEKVDEWFDKIADYRDVGEYENQSAVEEDVFSAAFDELNDHNIDAEKLSLEELISRHDFSQFVRSDTESSTWTDTRVESHLRKGQEDAIIREMFRHEIS